MKVFLLWHRVAEQDPDPECVASDLRSVFAPLFRRLPQASIRQTPAATMVWLELPVRGWKPDFFQEDEDTWALAPDYPVDARAVLAANGTNFEDDGVLPTLGRRLRENPAPLLREMAPPYLCDSIC